MAVAAVAGNQILADNTNAQNVSVFLNTVINLLLVSIVGFLADMTDTSRQGSHNRHFMPHVTYSINPAGVNSGRAVF